MKSRPKAQTIRKTRMDSYPTAVCRCFSSVETQRALAQKKKDEQNYVSSLRESFPNDHEIIIGSNGIRNLFSAESTAVQHHPALAGMMIKSDGFHHSAAI